MAKLKTVLLMGALLATSAFAADKNTNKSTEYLGEISDSQCAFAVHSKSGSHEQVKNLMGGSTESCTKACVGMGGKYVLMTSKDHKIFNLDNQELAAKFPGKKVKVTGSPVENGKALQVQSIVVAE